MNMLLPTLKRLRFFGRNKNLAIYLTKWRTSPLTYTPSQAKEAGWKHDTYEELVCDDRTGHLFQRAGELLRTYQFYPHTIMSHASDFSAENRSAQVGDRICQRIKLFHPFGLPILDVLTMNEVTHITDEPTCQGMGYTSTAKHDEVGFWSARIEWRTNKQLVLVIESVSRPAKHMPAFLHPLTRTIQLRAHRQGIQTFKQRVCQEYK